MGYWQRRIESERLVRCFMRLRTSFLKWKSSERREIRGNGSREFRPRRRKFGIQLQRLMQVVDSPFILSR